MVIFIDESGIQNQIGHSTVAVVYVEIKNLNKFNKDFIKILSDLRISFFHWTEERWLIRGKFLSKVLKLSFRVKVAIFKNPVHSDRMMESVFEQIITEPSVDKILIDAKKPRWYENKLKKILRQRDISLKKLKTVRKDEYVFGIQLADCLAGLYRYHYDNPSNFDTKSWIQRLKRHQVVFGEFFLEAKK